MKKITTAAVAFCLALAMIVMAACVNPDSGKALGEVAAYSVDLTSMGYDLKVTDGTWQQTYDKIIELVKKEGDSAKRYALMHKAEDLLMSTGCIVPIYYYTDIYMIKSNITGFFSSPLGYKFFSNTEVGGSTANIDVCLASEPDTIDPALNSAVDGATIISHVFAGLVKWSQNASGALELVADCAKAIPTPTEGADGKMTYVFELKDGLKWSDGSELKASDFEYAWKRASSAALAADYGYMFDVIDGYSVDEEGAFNGALNVTANNTANTLTVVLTTKCAYFIELCAFPTYFPVKESVVSDEAWATSPATYIGNGAYKVTSWTHNSVMTLEKNAYYHDAASVKMKKITNHLSDNDATMLANFKTGEWQFIDSVPNDEITSLKTTYPDEFIVAGQLGTYYFIFNINANLLPASSTLEGKAKVHAQEEIRNAIGLLIDRNYICESIGKAGQEPASSFVAKGLTEPDGTEFYQKAGSAEGYNGYYNVAKAAHESNVASAIATLKKYFSYDEATKKFTDFPTISYLYNKGTGHQAIGEYLQACFAAYGITMDLESQEWNTFLNTRKQGNYVAARNGWLADFNDPISFLDMWTSISGNNDAQFGKTGAPV